MKKTTIILAAIWIAVLATILAAATAREKMAGLEKVLDTRLLEWEQSLDDSRWETYKPGRSIIAPVFYLRAHFTAPALLAAKKVTGTPLALKVKMSARGLVQATFFLDDRELEQAAVHGESGTAAEADSQIALTPQADNEAHVLRIAVENRGFVPARTGYWPERRRGAPVDEGSEFVLQTAELFFPAAEPNRNVLQNWLQAFQLADTLLNPELKRFTFTGKPYDIPDMRRVDKAKLARLNAAFDRAVAAFDQQALAVGDWPRVQASLKRALRLAGDIKAYLQEFRVNLVGNAHIDIAWLWRMAETMALSKNTYQTVIANMGEYRELTYAQSQAVTYDWIEKKHPDLFRQIKEKVRAGRWEIVGGMWVEPDCNLIAGESWARQLLYGKKYFREKFGADVRIGWNPDSFGYNWNMPQLYKLGGIDSFITQKLWWNDTTVFPHFLFNWQGVDGSTILTYMPPLSYDSSLQLKDVANGISKYEATTGLKESLILYGLGDHGGGPNREILDRVRGYGKLALAPKFIHTTPSPFLQKKRSDKLDLPLWKDELYLEYHQGTFTTQGAIKKNNRRTEALLATIEKVSSIAYLLGGKYPKEKMEENWKSALTLQFHDILPGSSITPVYRDALETFKTVQEDLGRLKDGALEKIASNINTAALPGTPLLVFNPLSWERDDVVTLSIPISAISFLKGYHDLQLLDEVGHDIVFQISPMESCSCREIEISFIASKVPPLGYRVYSLVPAPKKPMEEITLERTERDFEYSGFLLENEALRVVIDDASGNITSIFDKRLNREFVAPGEEANKLWVYEDRPENWDAWNIGYTGRGWELNKAVKVELLSSGPVKTVYRIDKSFLGLSKERSYPTEDFPSSFFKQYITLYNGLDRIDIRTEADWWEDHLSLKACFPIAVKADEAYYEIPFAAIGRNTHFETLWEKARYEVPALRWADLSDEKGGIALLNDSKYGHDIHGNVMKLSLLRSPTWPDPLADRGRHEFTYSIYPHAGKWNESQVVHRGQELNQPLIARILEKHGGSLPLSYSFFGVESEGVILDAIKLAEDGSGLVFRLYEANGKAENAVLAFFRKPARVATTDLLENEFAPLQFMGNRLKLSFRPFEIKTVKVSFPPPAAGDR
ncbi:MAG: glycosyl hydrolase-related protein [Candidatus Aminicenantes bacterium]|nr:glycosyl hydrolase-related protein [Candidatus Aminicenantes bacterium]